MKDPPLRRRRLLKPPVLLIVLAITTGWAQGASPVDRTLAFGRVSHVVPTSISTAERVSGRDDTVVLASRTEPVAEPVRSPDRTFVAHLQRHELAVAKVAVAKAAVAKATATKPAAPRVPAPVKKSISGRNHFWIPSLGMSYPVHLFECTRKREPGNYIYRWGCAGSNNVYILGHASSVMKPLHDAYERGRLRVGMLAKYADGAGHIRSYRVTEWRVVDPVDSHWAIASQSVPSMTLQTCVGPGGVDRLNVRLVAVD